MAGVEVGLIGIDPMTLGVDQKIHWASDGDPNGRKEKHKSELREKWHNRSNSTVVVAGFVRRIVWSGELKRGETQQIMPSFDVVSRVDWHEVANAVDQANREVRNRFDFKGSDARVEQAESCLTIHANDEYRVGQVRDILESRLAKRGVDIGCLAAEEVRESSGGKAQQEITVRAGIDSDLARLLVKTIKANKMKVQTAIQADQLRVSGKKRDDLQSVIALLDEEKVGLPLQYVNFRD